MGRFRDALAAPGLAAIAEIKRRSPSAGELRPDADPALLAPAFAAAGAAAISVLVDERFGGSLTDLQAAHAATDVPLLAKGFFREELDLLRARLAGADAVLLLLRDLDDARARSLDAYAHELGMETLVEVHDAEELRRAVELDARIVGINARNLEDFSLDRRAQLELVQRTPRDRVIVAESAVHSAAQAASAELAGANAVLVGTALMRAADPPAKLRELLRRPLVKVCGLTRQDDVDAAVEAGADLVGFIHARESPRRTDELLAVPDTVLRVSVFVGEHEDTEADVVQLYERIDDHRSRDGVLLRNEERVATVVDLPWQETDVTHLERAQATKGRVMLAGGLSPENVDAAIAAVRPWAVDSARSTEREPGVKDHDKVRAWVQAARR
jgi:indole-3-glycerol phosphate synthase/phosphoribosylanthranilate isomerase